MNYYKDLGTNQAAMNTFGPADVVQTVNKIIEGDPRRRMLGTLDPLAIAGDQEVFLVWLSYLDTEDENQSPFEGNDLRIFRIPLPVDDSLVARTLMHGSVVRETAMKAAEAAYQKRLHNYPTVYAFKDGYTVCFTPGNFPGLEVVFSDTDQLQQDKVFQLWSDAPIVPLDGRDEEQPSASTD
ncbi:hypothetical protein FMM01_11885 [Schleiferilactobacillus harbinensis]|uniref:hypothetical protein n=1 Tax=Schleiferilactobacillus harbinensis TaxID=304207 RepID=UPI00123C7263|nr:hypothetical protein [Schleiferilactobacillus harbinensis]QEU47949.1 hypothetical protein FMM01_11885 [Schleiferilactobacillus harbinensis]